MQRSIQDIVPPSRNKPLRERPTNAPQAPHRDFEERINPPTPPRRPQRTASSGSGGPSRVVWIIAGVVVILAITGVVLASTVFRGSVLTITPKQKTVQISTTIVAATAPSTDQIPLQVITAEDSATQKVPATGEETVQDHASGTIVIYNAYSTKPQRLIKNTRFQTSAGLIFRIQNSVTVPGTTVQAGKTIPGSIEATVYADEAGDKYNVGLSDFTLPGLKGSAQFDTVYARSKTPMQGGFIGTRKVVDPAARDAAVTALKQSLTISAYQKLAANVPEGFILFDDARSVTFDLIPDQTDGSNAVIGVHAAAHGIVLPILKLAESLAAQGIAGYAGEDVTISNPTALTGTIATNTDPQPWTASQVSFSISGTPHIVWILNETQLKTALAGKPEKDLQTTLASYPAIDRAETTMYPVWSSSFPTNTSRITIKQVVNP